MSAAQTAEAVQQLLAALRSQSYAGRIKALRQFSEYYLGNLPEVYESDVRLLLTGDEEGGGLVQWAGEVSSNAQRSGELKRSSARVLSLLTRIVDPLGELDNGESPFLRSFLSLPLETLRRLRLGLHVDSIGASERHEDVVSLLRALRSAAATSAVPLSSEHLVQSLVSGASARARVQEWLDELDDMDVDEEREDPTTWAEVAEQVAQDSLISSSAPVEGAPSKLVARRTAASALEDPLGLRATCDVAAATAAPAAKAKRPKGKGKRLLKATKRLAGSSRDLFHSQKSGSQEAAAEEPAATAAAVEAQAQAEAETAAAAAAAAAAAKEANKPTAPQLNAKSASFDPVRFLQHVHGESGFDDLQRGQQFLAQGMDDQEDRRRELVRSHFHDFVRCRDAIESLHAKLSPEAESAAGSHLDGLGRRLAGAAAEADSHFQPLLERVQQVARLRQSVGVLRRLDFLFDLPSSMRHDLTHSDYELLIRNYNKARGLLEGLDPDASVLLKVYAVVEANVARVHSRLLELLEDPDAPLDVQWARIQHLRALRCPVDPALHCMGWQAQHLRRTLAQLQAEAQADPAARLRTVERVAAVARARMVPMLQLLARLRLAAEEEADEDLVEDEDASAVEQWDEAVGAVVDTLQTLLCTTHSDVGAALSAAPVEDRRHLIQSVRGLWAGVSEEAAGIHSGASGQEPALRGLHELALQVTKAFVATELAEARRGAEAYTTACMGAAAAAAAAATPSRVAAAALSSLLPQLDAIERLAPDAEVAVACARSGVQRVCDAVLCALPEDDGRVDARTLLAAVASCVAWQREVVPAVFGHALLSGGGGGGCDGVLERFAAKEAALLDRYLDDKASSTAALVTSGLEAPTSVADAATQARPYVTELLFAVAMVREEVFGTLGAESGHLSDILVAVVQPTLEKLLLKAKQRAPSLQLFVEVTFVREALARLCSSEVEGLSLANMSEGQQREADLALAALRAQSTVLLRCL